MCSVYFFASFASQKKKAFPSFECAMFLHVLGHNMTNWYRGGSVKIEPGTLCVSQKKRPKKSCYVRSFEGNEIHPFDF